MKIINSYTKIVCKHRKDSWYKSLVVLTFDIKYQWTLSKDTYNQIKLIQASRRTQDFNQNESFWNFAFDCNGCNCNGKMYGRISPCRDWGW